MSGPARDVRLIRVDHLRAAQQVIATLAAASPAGPDRAIVVVPTVHAARELQRTIEILHRTSPADAALVASLGLSRPNVSDGAATLPVILTRAGLLEDLHRRLGPGAPRLLGVAARHAMLWRAADEASAAGVAPPFDVRPGLLPEMLALYDQLRRNRRSADDFARVTTETLEPGALLDRGAARLLEQTRFLVQVFGRYELARDATGALDEHTLRARLAQDPGEPAAAHVVLTVGDQVADPDGLWPADFELLLQLPGLERVDVVATATTLDAGLRSRLYDFLPGVHEQRWDGGGAAPVLVTPPGDDRRSHVSRDREEELREVARFLVRAVQGGTAGSEPASGALDFDDVVIAYERPLPYVYLARRVLGAAGVPFTIADALPLAAEPYVAAMDLVFDVVQSDFARGPVLRLLESPLVTWRRGGRPLAPADVLAFDEWLTQGGFEQGRDALAARVATPLARSPEAAAPRAVRLSRAIEAAATMIDDLAPLAADAPMAARLRRLRAVMERREARDAPAGSVMMHDERHARARGATLDLLDELADAHEAHGNRVASLRELVSLVRRAVERQTFTPTSGLGGVRLMEARAARYAQAKAIWIVGLVEGEWPARSRGSIFYPTSMLLDLGFAREQDRLPAARAAFLDLLSVASSEVRVSSFQLEDDAIVRPSVFLEELQEVALETRRESAALQPLHHEPVPGSDRDRSLDPGDSAPPQAAGAWRAWRAARRDFSAPRFHGVAGPPPARVLSVTEVERYLECPFRYFATYELRLQEEEDEARVGLDPRTRGTVVHEVFQRFFDSWSAAGRGAIAPADLESARAMLAEVVDACLAALPEADRVLERTRLLGSAAAPGLGERVFRLEALRPTPVVERLLEFNLRGTYTFEATPPVRLELRGKADRIDLLADGTLRLIDYKTGRAPDPRRAVQLAIYALCAEQRLDGYRGRRWTLGHAAYLALADKRPWISIADGGDREALAVARDRFLGAIDGIARGEFPPRPADPRLCLSCPFSGVSRKEGDVGPGRP